MEKVKPEVCRPTTVVTLWSNNDCYEVDEATRGQQYGKAIEKRQCAPANTLFAFDQAKGECWLVDATNPTAGFRMKVNRVECRPPETSIDRKFVPAAAGIGGDCLEVDRTEGEQRWWAKLDPRLCKPTDTTFTWRSKGELKGDCWEVSQVSPATWSAPSKIENCRPSATATRFERKTEKSGDCYEVDATTMGLQWALKVTPERCL